MPELTPATNLICRLIAGTLYFLVVTMSTAHSAENTILDDFSNRPDERWEFIADTVMGGVSSGRVTFVSKDGQTALKLSGLVSTANNGGFIQARLPLPAPLPEQAKGGWLKVKGNHEQYFVHLRTAGTVLPWQYYQAGFDANDQWTMVKLPWDVFQASGGLSGSLLRDTPLPQKIKSIAIVAFGRDYEAQIEVSEIGYY